MSSIVTNPMTAFRACGITLEDEKQQIYCYNPWVSSSLVSTVSSSSTVSSTATERKSKVKRSSSSEEIDPILKTKRAMSVKAKRDSTNRDACQQMFLMYMLLSEGYRIILRKPRKRSNKTMQLFVIDRIVNKVNEIVYDINEFSSTSQDEKVNRRNLDSYVNDKMIGMIREMGCYVEIKKGKKAEKTTQYERIERVNRGDNSYSYSHMKTIGISMDQYIRNQMAMNNYVLHSDNFINMNFTF